MRLYDARIVLLGIYMLPRFSSFPRAIARLVFPLKNVFTWHVGKHSYRAVSTSNTLRSFTKGISHVFKIDFCFCI